MKKFINLIAFLLFIIIIDGCSSSIPTTHIPVKSTVALLSSPISPTPTPESTPSSNAILLDVNGEKITFEFLQNGKSISVSGSEKLWNVTLKPAPFTLMVYGNKKTVSIAAFKPNDTFLPLTQITRPLLQMAGSANGFHKNNLWVKEKPLEIFQADLLSFEEIGLSTQEAEETTEFLKSQLYTEPFIIMSARIYLDTEYSGSSNYDIRTINEKPIQNGESIMLAVFADQQELPQDPQNMEWTPLSWLVFKIDFLSN